MRINLQKEKNCVTNSMASITWFC